MQTQKVKNEDSIRAAAHSIWEAEGRPEGQAEIHWQRASESVAAPKPEVAAKPAKATKAKAPKKN